MLRPNTAGFRFEIESVLIGSAFSDRSIQCEILPIQSSVYVHIEACAFSDFLGHNPARRHRDWRGCFLPEETRSTFRGVSCRPHDSRTLLDDHMDRRADLPHGMHWISSLAGL